MYDGSYLRLKYAEISYTFSKEKWLKSAGLQSLKLYVNGNNLALWTSMPDDRESNTGGWSAFVQFYGTNNVSRYVSLESLGGTRNTAYHELRVTL